MVLFSGYFKWTSLYFLHAYNILIDIWHPVGKQIGEFKPWMLPVSSNDIIYRTCSSMDQISATAPYSPFRKTNILTIDIFIQRNNDLILGIISKFFFSLWHRKTIICRTLRIKSSIDVGSKLQDCAHSSTL